MGILPMSHRAILALSIPVFFMGETPIGHMGNACPRPDRGMPMLRFTHTRSEWAVSDFRKDAGQQASAIGGVVGFRASDFRMDSSIPCRGKGLHAGCGGIFLLTNLHDAFIM